MISERVLAAYGFTGAHLLPVQKGYRNQSHGATLPNGERVNLIIYKREPGILATLKRANQVGDHLAHQGFPARHSRDPRIIRLQSGPRTQYAALYAYLPGHTIPWEAYTMEHLKQLGATMSTMHQLLAQAPFTLQNHVNSEYLAIVQRMQRYFADPHVQQALHAKLALQVTVPDHFARILTGCAGLPNQQPLHMDFVRGNVLFNEQARITGVLDFEKTAHGHPLFDIARTLAFLLVDCKYKTEAQVYKYFLHSGYNKRGPHSFKVTAHNTQILEALIDLFLLYDFYKFLHHNPYESLPANEHFLRTRQLLLQRRLLAPAGKTPHTVLPEGG